MQLANDDIDPSTHLRGQYSTQHFLQDIRFMTETAEQNDQTIGGNGQVGLLDRKSMLLAHDCRSHPLELALAEPSWVGGSKPEPDGYHLWPNEAGGLHRGLPP